MPVWLKSTASGYVSTGMAHLPRWIEWEHVDSRAMYSACSYYIDQCMNQQEALELSDLYTVDHYPYFSDTNYLDYRPWRRCAKLQCPRCSSSRGGYTFHWYDLRWDAHYRAMARPGSWKPGDDLAYGTTSDHTGPIAPTLMPAQVLNPNPMAESDSDTSTSSHTSDDYANTPMTDDLPWQSMNNANAPMHSTAL